MANNVPNFDAMDREELMEFWKKYHRPSRKDAEALIGDRRKRFTSLASTLACYASNKAAAIACRLQGNMPGAQAYELICDRVYDKLPADLKW